MSICDVDAFAYGVYNYAFWLESNCHCVAFGLLIELSNSHWLTHWSLYSKKLHFLGRGWWFWTWRRARVEGLWVDPYAQQVPLVQQLGPQLAPDVGPGVGLGVGLDESEAKHIAF